MLSPDQYNRARSAERKKSIEPNLTSENKSAHESKLSSSNLPSGKLDYSVDNAAYREKLLRQVKFDDFWYDYLSAHKHPMTQLVHALGTVAGVSTGILAISKGAYSVLPAIVLATYGVLGMSHLIFEKNTPVTLRRNPLKAARADFRLTLRYFLRILHIDMRILALRERSKDKVERSKGQG